jgi:hypothetical protein
LLTAEHSFYTLGVWFGQAFPPFVILREASLRAQWKDPRLQAAHLGVADLSSFLLRMTAQR